MKGRADDDMEGVLLRNQALPLRGAVPDADNDGEWGQVTEALEEALRWASRHPGSDLYDPRSYVEWVRDESMVLEPLESDEIRGSA